MQTSLAWKNWALSSRQGRKNVARFTSGLSTCVGVKHQFWLPHEYELLSYSSGSFTEKVTLQDKIRDWNILKYTYSKLNASVGVSFSCACLATVLAFYEKIENWKLAGAYNFGQKDVGSGWQGHWVNVHDPEQGLADICTTLPCLVAKPWAQACASPKCTM